MSEKILHEPKGHEHDHEHIKESAETSRRNLERLHKEADKEKQPANVEQLQAEVKEHARGSDETTVGEKESVPSPVGVQKELKNSAYKQTIKHIQTKLKGPEKTLSRVIHQPVVEKISNVGAKTIARPSGVLGGGVFALSGSSVLLFMTKHYGFEYNYSVFFLLFIGGFVVGLIIEALLSKRLARKRNATE